MDYFSTVWFFLLMLAGGASLVPCRLEKQPGWSFLGVALILTSLLRLWQVVWCGSPPGGFFDQIPLILTLGAALAALIAAAKFSDHRLPYFLGVLLLIMGAAFCGKGDAQQDLFYARWLIWVPAFLVLSGSVLLLQRKHTGSAAMAHRLFAVGLVMIAFLNPVQEAFGKISKSTSSQGNILPVGPELLWVMLTTIACSALMIGSWICLRERRLAGMEMDLRGRRRGRVLGFLLILVLTAGWFWTSYSSKHADSLWRSELEQEAQLVSSSIAPSLVSQLSGTRTDENLAAYKTLKMRLADIVKSSGSYRFAYLMTYKDGQVVFLVDNEPDNSKDESHAGDVYTDAEPELLAAFDLPHAFVTGPYPDQWGIWITGYAPIVHTTMNGVPVYLGIDDNAADWCVNLDRLRLEKMLEILTLALFVTGLLAINALTGESRMRQIASEDRLRLSLQGANLVSWEMDLDAQALLIDPGVGKAGDLINLPARLSMNEFLKHIHPEDTEKVKEAHAQLTQGGKASIETEFRLRKADGSYLWVISRGHVTRSGKAEAKCHAAGLIFDISERKKTELELLRQKKEAARLALVAESTTSAVIITDKESVIEWVNAGFTKITGYAFNEVLGRKLSALLDVNVTKPEAIERIKGAFSSNQGFKERLLTYHKTGRPCWIDIECQPLFGETGEPTGYMAIESDVTVSVEAEKALREAKNAADAANRAKSTFLATMSHEIRTPLNAVIGISSLLLETNLESQQRDYAATISSSGEILLELIDDILDYSKIEAGKVEVERYPFSLSDVLNETLELVTRPATEKKIGLSCAVNPSLPQKILGDRMRLKQVLLNLFSNAVKFTEHGSVSVHAEPLGKSMLRITVTDTGIGMSKEVQSRLFVPFMQADSSVTRKYGGTGLGLAISKRLVELMGGTITVRSQEREGTAFCIELPLQEAMSEAEASRELPAIGSAQMPIADRHSRTMLPFFAADKSSDALGDNGRNSLAELRVLVAEDNPINQKVIKMLLSRLGVTPVVVWNGVQVLETVKEKTFDLLLIDIQMPVMDGLEATRRLLEYFREGGRPQIVALTANAFKEDREACLAAGMDGYLVKPITLDRLRGVLEKVRGGMMGQNK